MALGPKVDLYINDKLIKSISDLNRTQKGRIGLFASNKVSGQKTRVVFSKVKLYGISDN